MAGEHISLYQLTIEPETAFGDRFARGGLKDLPDEDLQADMYMLTQDICTAAGLESYEISNHSRAGAESAHNLIYWRAGDWMGIGPGAHGRLTVNGERVATEAMKAPVPWLLAVESGTGIESRHGISAKDAAEEYLMMGLRVRDGVELGRLGALQVSDKIEYLQVLKLVNTDGDRLWASESGRPVLNGILRELLAG